MWPLGRDKKGSRVEELFFVVNVPLAGAFHQVLIEHVCF